MFVLSISNFWKKEQKATSFVCLHENRIRNQFASPDGIYTHFKYAKKISQQKVIAFEKVITTT